MTKTFENLMIGGLFHLNGQDYIKQSTRTAAMLSNARTFYFGKTERVYQIEKVTKLLY